MKYTIDKEVLEKYNLSIEEFLVLLINHIDGDYTQAKESLIARGIVHQHILMSDKVVLSDNSKDLVTAILVESDSKVVDKDEEYTALAEKLKEVYPKGRKPGTSYMWRDATGVIARKLKAVCVQFDVQLSESKAVEATKAYVNSFNGDYTYMQLLKYFILKKDPKTGELRSDFLSYLENEDTTENRDWNVTVK
jgi:hypothetical protein